MTLSIEAAAPAWHFDMVRELARGQIGAERNLVADLADQYDWRHTLAERRREERIEGLTRAFARALRRELAHDDEE